MEETIVLLVIVVVTFVGSYASGSLPLVMPMREERLFLISVFGAGLLVGTALAVIIPEGVATLHHDHIQSTSAPEVHSLIGISLLLGFLFMLLLDYYLATRNRGTGSEERVITPRLGLLVHAAADGVALGAAAKLEKPAVEAVLFLTIMFHKAPAAFGLVSFLLQKGVEKNRIRWHLLVFSLSSPVLALLTYFGIGQRGKETLSSVNATGLVLLFSAGTFLYVSAVHILPELICRTDRTLGVTQIEPTVEKKGLSTKEFILLIAGILLALWFSVVIHFKKIKL